MAGLIECPVCHKQKSVAFFYGGKGRAKKRHICNDCASRSHRPSRDQVLMYNYGISQAHYDVMLFQQADCCAICGEQPRTSRRLVVDHDHATGRVRALLCDRCNTGLGHFGDDIKLMRKAIRYLQYHGQTRGDGMQ